MIKNSAKCYIIPTGMKVFKLSQILILSIFLVIAGKNCHAQSVSAQSDTVKVSMQDPDQDDAAKTRNNNAERGNQNRKAENKGASKGVKQVKSAKPDMSRAKGARPNIVRPSGSGIPKGVGKPAGAGRPGGR